MKSLFLIVTIITSVSRTLFANELTPINQGWSAQEKEMAYHMDLGAEVMPWRWFFALETAESTAKLSEQTAKFGLVNRNGGLPIGVSERENTVTAKLYGEKKWIGVNCTACHTSRLNINGKSVVVDGNQSLFRIQEFESSIVNSVSATLSDQEKFNRFARRLNVADTAGLLKLKYYLKLFKSEFGDWYNNNHRYYDPSGTEVRYGPGRLDGLGGSTNTFACRLTDRMGGNSMLARFVTNPKNCHTSNPPVSFPYLWGMTQLQFAQWNDEVHASIIRNVGAMMAGYSKNWIELDKKNILSFRSTVNVENVVKMEKLYKKLRSPSWNDLANQNVVSALDLDSVARGQQIFSSRCLQCHAIQPESTPPNKYGNSYWKTTTVPIAEVGTDDLYLKTENERRAHVPFFLGKILPKFLGDDIVAEDGTVAASLYRGFMTGATLLTYYKENSLSQSEIDRLSNCRDLSTKQTTLGIKARSLEGVVWTAPFLHNGSVPTLRDLFSPAQQRPKTFHLGCNRYDSENGGFICDQNSENAFLFDTTASGNSNAGHEYGTDLKENQKTDLIQFLKSLEQPKDAFPINPDCH